MVTTGDMMRCAAMFQAKALTIVLWVRTGMESKT